MSLSMVNVSELPSASEAAEASEAAGVAAEEAVSRVPVPEVRLLRPAGLGAAVLAVPVAAVLAVPAVLRLAGLCDAVSPECSG